MNENEILQLQAWVDGELSGEDARRAAALSERSAEAREFVASLKQLRLLLQANEPTRAVPESPEFYWSRIRRGIESQERALAESHTPGVPRTSPLSGWLGWLIPASVFAAVALIALIPDAPQDSHPARRSTLSAAAMVNHVVETPKTGMSSLTFYSSRDSVTVVWVDHANLL